MNLQFRPRQPYPETALIVLKTVVVCAALAGSIYFFALYLNLLFGFISLISGIFVLALIGWVWPKPLPVVVMNEHGILDRRASHGRCDSKKTQRSSISVV